MGGLSGFLVCSWSLEHGGRTGERAMLGRRVEGRSGGLHAEMERAEKCSQMCGVEEVLGTAKTMDEVLRQAWGRKLVGDCVGDLGKREDGLG